MRMRPVEDYGLRGEIGERKNGAFRSLRHSGASFTVDFSDCVFVNAKLNEQKARGRIWGRGDYEENSRIGNITIGVPGCRFDIDIVGYAHVAQTEISLEQLRRYSVEDHDTDLRIEDLPPVMAGQDPILVGLISRAVLGGEQEFSARAVAARLLERRDEARGRVSRRLTRKGGIPPARLRRVTEYVREKLQGPITLEMMAEQAAMSPFHFARAFRVETGMSAYSYLVERRLTRAIDLLREGKEPIDAIAMRSGFTHSSHLGRFLRQRFGVSGRDMRSVLTPDASGPSQDFRIAMRHSRANPIFTGQLLDLSRNKILG